MHGHRGTCRSKGEQRKRHLKEEGKKEQTKLGSTYQETVVRDQSHALQPFCISDSLGHVAD